MSTKDWWSAGNEWLIKKANNYFKVWLETKQGKAWRKRLDRNRKSPYHCDFTLPEWIHEAQAALGKGNEEEFKAIKLRELMYIK